MGGGDRKWAWGMTKRKRVRRGFIGDLQIPNMGDRWIMALLPEVGRNGAAQGKLMGSALAMSVKVLWDS